MRSYSLHPHTCSQYPATSSSSSDVRSASPSDDMYLRINSKVSTQRETSATLAYASRTGGSAA